MGEGRIGWEWGCLFITRRLWSGVEGELTSSLSEKEGRKSTGNKGGGGWKRDGMGFTTDFQFKHFFAVWPFLRKPRRKTFWAFLVNSIPPSSRESKEKPIWLSNFKLGILSFPPFKSGRNFSTLGWTSVKNDGINSPSEEEKDSLLIIGFHCAARKEEKWR